MRVITYESQAMTRFLRRTLIGRIMLGNFTNIGGDFYEDNYNAQVIRSAGYNGRSPAGPVIHKERARSAIQDHGANA
jgi:hypothetical protein